MNKLPIGKQDFRSLIQGGYRYVDKTPLLMRLLDEGEAFFCARPRRFGKSLLISTLGCLLRAERELFHGLFIQNSGYDWPSHPVIELNLARVHSSSPMILRSSLNHYFVEIAHKAGIEGILQDHPSDTLAMLINQLSKHGRVVILIDEYDKPVLDQIAHPKIAESNRQLLGEVFTTLKSMEAEIRFLFITGVTKFSKVSLFSGLNHLNDISLDPAYATLLGITESELMMVFKDHLTTIAEESHLSLEKVIERMRYWYNGYSFSRAENGPTVYNPWSILNHLLRGELENYWFETGTPRFAIELIERQEYPLIRFEEGVLAGSEIHSGYEPHSIDLVSLLFQSGYLTIKEYNPATRVYRLAFPNEEVRRSFLDHLYIAFTGQQLWQPREWSHLMREQLYHLDLKEFFHSFNQQLASIPYSLHIAKESYYHSLLYLLIRNLGFQAEVMTNRGRIDLIVTRGKVNILCEFKIDSSAEEALAQMRSKEYANRFRSPNKRVLLVGANFNTTKRQIDEWLAEEA